MEDVHIRRGGREQQQRADGRRAPSSSSSKFEGGEQALRWQAERGAPPRWCQRESQWGVAALLAPADLCTSASGPLCEEELALTAELFPELSHELGLPPAPPLQQLSTDPPGVRAAKRERSACAQPDRDGRAPSPALAAQQQQQQQHSSAEFNQSHAPTVQTSAPAIAARADSLAQARVHIQLALPPARVVLHGKVPAHPLQHPTITTGAAGYHGASPSKRCRHWHKHPPLPGPAN